jgi:mono/diheme cytochrome c family protein
MKLYRVFAFAAAVAIVLLLASAPGLMLRAEARHRQLTVTADRAMPARGKTLFETDCAACHQENGEGIAGVFPALKGNRAVNKPDPTHHIHAVLFGERGMRVGGVRYLGRMPPFGAQLSDRDVAAIVNFERGAWGNRGLPVTVSEVASVRATGVPAKPKLGIGDHAGQPSPGQKDHNAPASGAGAFLLTLTSIALDLSALSVAGR